MTGALSDAERERMNGLLRALVLPPYGDSVPAPLPDRSGFLVSRAHFVAREQGNDILRPYGITVRHFGLLTLLGARGPSSQQAIARALMVSATMVTQLVDHVEALGLAERRREPRRPPLLPRDAHPRRPAHAAPRHDRLRGTQRALDGRAGRGRRARAAAPCCGS